MPAARHDLLIEKGSTFRLEVTWKDSAGAPVDLDGYSAKAQVRKSYTSEPVLTFDSADNSIELGDGGKITLLASATQTSALPISSMCVWDLELTSAGDEVTRLLEGEVSFSEEVTR
jgi:hypothetical protein